MRYTIKLNQEEVVRLRSIINKGSHSTQTYRTALHIIKL